MIVQVDVVGHAIDHIDFGVGFEDCYNAGNGARVKDVIGVQPADDFSIGGADAFGDGIGLPLVFLRYPTYLWAETFEYFDRVVRAAAIEDHVLNFGTRLVGHALQRSLNELPLVKGGGDDADFHAEIFSGNNSIQAAFSPTMTHRCNITESSR